MVKTRTILTGIFASVGALLVGWQFGAATHSPTSTPLIQNPSAQNPSAQSPSTPAGGASDGTFTGSSIDTPYGSVQVAVTVSGGSISEVTALHLTDDGGRSVQISNYAAPILRSEVMQSQSAQVDMVSGATYTSEAYLSSLQSALDQAGR
jgi:uncharacterized protein with FMN-binding domain